MESKEYWICTTGMGPWPAKNWIKAGYKLIGRSKLSNPHPREITWDDLEFIKEKLPEWLKEHYPACRLGSDFDKLPLWQLKERICYQFTVLYEGEMFEGDIYRLQIGNGKDSVNIYIGKALIGNLETMKSEIKLIYPFFDEEWHSNIDDDTFYKPGDLW